LKNDNPWKVSINNKNSLGIDGKMLPMTGKTSYMTESYDQHGETDDFRRFESRDSALNKPSGIGGIEIINIVNN
jgi:hypothetical protein